MKKETIVPEKLLSPKGAIVFSERNSTPTRKNTLNSTKTSNKQQPARALKHAQP